MTTLYCKYIINKTLKNRREIDLMRCVEFVVLRFVTNKYKF